MKSNISNLFQIATFVALILGGIFIFTQKDMQAKLFGSKAEKSEETKEIEQSRNPEIEVASRQSDITNSTAIQTPPPTAHSSTGFEKDVVPTDTKIVAALTIPGVTESEVRAGLAAAKEVQDLFMKPLAPTLSPEEQKKLDKYVAEIMATKEATSGSGNLVIQTQKPGHSVVVDSASLSSKGFIVILNGSNMDEILGVSDLLDVGTVKSITISLNRYIDGEGLVAYLRKDNGDGVYNWETDVSAMDSSNYPIFKSFDVGTRRNPQNVYYSNYSTNGSPVFVIREQLPGNRIVFDSVSEPFSFTGPSKSYFISIYEDNNGLPGRMIGNKLIKFASNRGEVFLDEPVIGESLYAMLFEDNGDLVFNPVTDRIVRGENNFLIIVKFNVIE